MSWMVIIIAGLITYFCRFSMVTVIKSEMLNEKTRLILSYVPSAVFPAIIFPAVFLNDVGLLDDLNNPKITAATIAVLIGYLAKNVIATILSGLISYWIIIFLLYELFDDAFSSTETLPPPLTRALSATLPVGSFKKRPAREAFGASTTYEAGLIVEEKPLPLIVAM